jgi:DNA repair exonuclease SbcCD nuclease subunit
MRFAVLADAHIGRSIPLAIAEHRREAFSRAFTRAVDAIVEAGCDYVFICGDLFERRTLRPRLVQFAHDQLYRLARETEERHGKRVKILAIRGNHDGRPQSDTLDYIKHPLAGYLHVFEEDAEPYADESLTVVGLNYYDRIDAAYRRLAEPALKKARGLKILMLHGFVQGYNQVPPYSSSLSLDDISEAEPDYVFTGHYHKRSREKRLPSGGWILTPGSLEMYDFGEKPEKGLYIVDHGEEPRFTWVPIEPMHAMKRALVETERRQTPRWFSEHIFKQVELFRTELEKTGKPGYLRIRVRGPLKDGFPGDIDLDPETSTWTASAMSTGKTRASSGWTSTPWASRCPSWPAPPRGSGSTSRSSSPPSGSWPRTSGRCTARSGRPSRSPPAPRPASSPRARGHPSSRSG